MTTPKIASLVRIILPSFTPISVMPFADTINVRSVAALVLLDHS